MTASTSRRTANRAFALRTVAAWILCHRVAAVPARSGPSLPSPPSCRPARLPERASLLPLLAWASARPPPPGRRSRLDTAPAWTQPPCSAYLCRSSSRLAP